MLFRRILVAFDGSEGSWRALRQGVAMAREQSSEILALSIVEGLPHYAATVGEVDEEKLRANTYYADHQVRAIAYAAQEGVRLQTATVPGHAAHAIAEFAKDGAYDLLVVGRSGHSGLWGGLLGTTTDRVSHQATCVVMIVP